MKDIADWREEIDRIDREIVVLLNKRAEAVLQLAPLKKQANRAVHDPRGPSSRSSARHSASGSGLTFGPRSISVPPASDSAKTAAA